MGHFRDRRAFGNVNGRRFRGARYGDGKSPRFTGLLDLYGGASAAYSLRALSRGWLAGDVVEVRPSSGWTPASFTANQVANGELVDYVKRPGNFLNEGFEAFANNGTGDGFTATNSVAVGFAYSSTVTGVSSDVVTIDFDIDIVSGSPLLSLRHDAPPLGGIASNQIIYTTSGSKSAVLTATDTFSNFTFSDGDVPAEYTISNVRVSTNDGFVSTWYDQSGNANDATQATTTAQPKIVDAGALVTGGLDFDGVDDWLETASAPMSVDELVSVYSVATFTTTTGRHRLVSDFLNTGSGFTGFDVQISVGNSALDFVGYGDGTATLQRQAGVSDITAGNEELYSVQLASGTSDLYINSDLKTTRDSTSMISGDTLKIGGINTTVAMDGNIQEIIVYNTNESANREAIETNINNHYSIY